MKTYGEWRCSSTILNLVTRWKWVVSLTLLLLYPWGESLPYSLDRRLGEPQSLSGRYAEEKNLFPLPGIESRFLGRPARSLVATPIELSRL
jgi:hypothetical protein